MWDTLGWIRELMNITDKDYFIIGLHQKNLTILFLDNIYERHFGFLHSLFIAVIKLLYKKSKVWINVNGLLTDGSAIHRGVKLYIIAMSAFCQLFLKSIQGIQYIACVCFRKLKMNYLPRPCMITCIFMCSLLSYSGFCYSVLPAHCPPEIILTPLCIS